MLWLILAHLALAPFLLLQAAAERVTLVDLIANSENHSLLLRAIQRARLIPVYNELNTSTFFAPSDHTIRRWSETSHIWSAVANDVSVLDKNTLYDLQDILLYHTLEENVLPVLDSVAMDEKGEFLFLESLLRPTLSRVPPPDPPNKRPHPTPSTSDAIPEPTDPWFFPFPRRPKPRHPSNESDPNDLLDGHGQRLRILRSRKNTLILQNSAVLDSNAPTTTLDLPNSVISPDGNIALIPLTRDSSLLAPPPSVRSVIEHYAPVFAGLLSQKHWHILESTPQITLFVPDDRAFQELPSWVLDYLRAFHGDMWSLVSTFFRNTSDATHRESFGDSTARASLHTDAYTAPRDTAPRDTTPRNTDPLRTSRTVSQKHYSTSQKKPISLDIPCPFYFSEDPGTDDGELSGVFHTRADTLEISRDITFDGSHHSLVAKVNGSNVTPDLFVRNGVVHIVPSLFTFQTPVTLAKYLAFTNRSDILDAFHSVHLAHFISDSSHPRTFFIPESSSGLARSGSPELKHQLLYHGLPGIVTKFAHDSLLETLDKPALLQGRGQVLPVSITHPSDSSPFLDMRLAAKSPTVFVGGVRLAAEHPISFKNTLVYTIDAPITAPGLLIDELSQVPSISNFVVALHSTRLDARLAQANGTSLFVPTNAAFQRLGLLQDLLLSDAFLLSSVLMYHTVPQLVYSTQWSSQSRIIRQFPTLNKDMLLYLETRFDGNLSHVGIHSPMVTGPLKYANGETRDAAITKSDILATNAVFHVIDQVELPPALSLSLQDLILKAAHATLFHKFLDAAGLLPFLTSSEANSYVLLCPTNAAFAKLNQTALLSDKLALRQLLAAHIIPLDAKTGIPPSLVWHTPEPWLQDNGAPLRLEDNMQFLSALDKSFGGIVSYALSYSRLGFRQYNGQWLVGITSARGANHSASVLGWARAPPRSSTSAGGGVILIDSVILPYVPGPWIYILPSSIALVFLGVAAAYVFRRRSAPIALPDDAQEDPSSS